MSPFGKQHHWAAITDASGLRTSKTVGGATTQYYWLGDKLQAQRTGNDYLIFLYDEASVPYGLIHKYGSTEITYYYEYNLQGDIIGIINDAGTRVVTYQYSAWGELLSTSGSMATSIGASNPLRYRGYYYDEETGFYYLQSRYYDPVTCRFINADSYVSTGQGILGNNMFAYCGNNPVSRLDYTGQFWGELWEFVKTAVSEIGEAIERISPAYAGCGMAAAGDGPLLFGDAVAVAGFALLTVGAVGYGIYQAAHSTAIAIQIAESKAEVISKDQKLPTVIYRYGGTNPGNLTPKAKDKYSGLSFSTVPMPGAAMTTIEALNATGVVYAIQDSATHVSVRPVGATMQEWIDAGSSSIWTEAVKLTVVKWGGE